MFEKIKETSISIGPIALVVVILGLTIVPMGLPLIFSFLICSVFTILGLSLFLLGADVGIIPIGDRSGSALTSKKNLPLLLIASFFIGFIITIAEPDVQVFASQVCNVNSAINSTLLVLMIALGIGFFVALGLLRTVLQIPIKIFYIACYLLIFVLASIAPKEFMAVAFDASGATTGPMTVPFILALGMGVASVKSHSNSDSKADNFGLTGLASVGPILAVLLLGIFLGSNSNDVAVAASEANSTVVAATFKSQIGSVFKLFPEVLIEVSKALLPLVGLFILFLFTLFKLTKRQIIKIFIGLFYSFVGLLLFLVGVNGGFIPAGTLVGTTLGGLSYNWILVILGVVLGAIVVCAEPAVWVLTKQVEEVSGGTIRRRVLMIFLSSAVAIAVGLAMLRVLLGFNIAFLLVPIYAVALTLTLFCPKLFTAIAFDSGGVASGPMTSSFILSFTLGVSTAVGGNPLSDAFGVIALVASAPLIAIQLLGLIFAKGGRKK